MFKRKLYRNDVEVLRDQHGQPVAIRYNLPKPRVVFWPALARWFAD